jgi:hypothetical protein
MVGAVQFVPNLELLIEAERNALESRCFEVKKKFVRASAHAVRGESCEKCRNDIASATSRRGSNRTRRIVGSCAHSEAPASMQEGGRVATRTHRYAMAPGGKHPPDQ